MPESRDRLSRSNNDIAERYSRRLALVRSLGVLPDIDDFERSVIRTPFRWGATPLTGDGSGQRIGEGVATRTATRGGVSGRGRFGTPMTVGRRGGPRQNMPPSGSSVRRGRGGRSSVLPSWYPRTPLRDITHVVGEHKVSFGEEVGILIDHLLMIGDKLTSMYDLLEQMQYLYVRVMKARDFPTWTLASRVQMVLALMNLMKNSTPFQLLALLTSST